MLYFIFHKPEKERTMERRLVIRIGLLASLLVMTALAGSAIAGGGQSGFEPPPAGATITGPELWAVFTVYCGLPQNFATLRVKRVVDCNTEVMTFVDPTLDGAFCPDEFTAEAATQLGLGFLQPRLENEWGITGNAFIDTVKNFDQQTDVDDNRITSFDAMIKFWTQ
jgi:hypothetical protein